MSTYQMPGFLLGYIHNLLNNMRSNFIKALEVIVTVLLTQIEEIKAQRHQVTFLWPYK